MDPEMRKQFRNLNGNGKLKDLVPFLKSDNYQSIYDFVVMKSRNLYLNQQKGLSPLDPNLSKQGPTGDCGLIAAIVGLAKLRPEDMERILPRHIGGGEAAIHAPWMANTGHFTLPGLARGGERKWYAHSEGGLWFPAMEAAFAQHQLDKHISYNPTNPVDRVLGRKLMREAHSHYVEDGIEFLTGHKAKTYRVHSGNKEAIKEQLHNALAKGRVVVLGACEDNRMGIAGNHAYSIIGFDPIKGTPIIRNPWGKGLGEREGIQEIGFYIKDPSGDKTWNSVDVKSKKVRFPDPKNPKQVIWSPLIEKEGRVGFCTDPSNPSSWHPLEGKDYREPGKIIFDKKKGLQWEPLDKNNDGIFSPNSWEEFFETFDGMWMETDTPIRQ